MAFAAASCSKTGPDAAQASPSAATGAQVPEVLATIGDQKITLADLRDRVGDQLDQLDANYNKARSRTIETALTPAAASALISGSR